MMHVFNREMSVYSSTLLVPDLPSIAKRHVGWEGGQKEVRDQLEVHLFHGLSKRPQSW